MVEYKGNDLSPELIRKAQACKSADELLALAKENGIDVTAEEAQAYLEELSSQELSLDDLDAVAGGFCRECYGIIACPNNKGFECGNKLACTAEADNPCQNKDWIH